MWWIQNIPFWCRFGFYSKTLSEFQKDKYGTYQYTYFVNCYSDMVLSTKRVQINEYSRIRSTGTLLLCSVEETGTGFASFLASIHGLFKYLKKRLKAYGRYLSPSPVEWSHLELHCYWIIWSRVADPDLFCRIRIFFAGSGSFPSYMKLYNTIIYKLSF